MKRIIASLKEKATSYMACVVLALMCTAGQNGIRNHITDSLEQKVQHYEETGELGNAVEVQKLIIHIQDSLYMERSLDRLEEAKREFPIDHIKRQQQSIKLKGYIKASLILFVLVLCMAVSAWLTMRYSKRISMAKRRALEAASDAMADNRAKDRLKTEVSHDVRTPLNVVVGFAELMTEPGLTLEEKQEYSSLIQSSAERLLVYINSVLELSRLESGKVQYRDEEYEIINIIKNIVETVNGHPRQLVKITLNSDVEEWRMKLDKSWFETILLSILLPIEGDEEQTDVNFCISRNTERGSLDFRIVNASIAQERQDNKTNVVRNEINAHFVSHLGGKYEIETLTTGTPVINFYFKA